MGRMNIFLVHGRDMDAVASVKDWFERELLEVNLITFADEFIPGETIPLELERLASQGDAAIVLVTPDDVGRYAGNGGMDARARENVWLELGWFWARLGRQRTLMLVRRGVELPSDTSGVLYLPYAEEIDEVSGSLRAFVDGIRSSKPSKVTEVISTATEPGARSGEYSFVRESAQVSALIMGIGMANVRHDLEHMFSWMQREQNDLHLRFLTPSLDALEEFSKLTKVIYREELLVDLEAFQRAMDRLKNKYPDVFCRVEWFQSDRLFTFSATVADPGELGSLMLAETILPTGGRHSMERPRLLLRKRVRDGLYDRYLAAIEDHMMNAKEYGKIS